MEDDEAINEIAMVLVEHLLRDEGPPGQELPQQQQVVPSKSKEENVVAVSPVKVEDEEQKEKEKETWSAEEEEVQPEIDFSDEDEDLRQEVNKITIKEEFLGEAEEDSGPMSKLD